MLRDVLTYPVRGPHTEGVFLPGLVLALGTAILLELPSLLAVSAVVPATVLVGFLGQVYADSVDGGTEPPPFGPLRTVVRTGVTALSVAAVYLVPAGVAVAVTLVGANLATVPSGSPSFGTSIRVFLGSTVVLLVALTAAYLTPVAVAAAIGSGSARAGLAVRSHVAAARDGPYFVGFWTGATMAGAGVAVAAALATLGRPGALAGVGVLFYALVAATYAVGRGVGTDGSPYDLLT